MKTPIFILILLTIPLLTEWLMARMQQRCIRLQGAIVAGLIIAFSFFALGHFIETDGMMPMLPGWIPFKSGVIYLTGIWEVMVATGLMTKAYRQLSLVLAMATLVVFFSANIHAALIYSGPGGHQWGPLYLLVRGPLQLLLIGWCLWAYRLSRRSI